MKGSIIDYCALFLLTFVVTITWMTFIFPPVARLDFSIYIMVANLVLHHQSIYPLFIGTALFPYTHPPSLIPFFLPFLWLRPDIATSLWNSISLICLIGAIVLILKMGSLFRFSYTLLILSAVLLLDPVRETFLFGQNNTVVLFFLVVAFFFSQKSGKNYQILSGIALGVASALKLFPFFLLFYFISKKQWVMSCSTICTFLFFLALGTLGHIAYIGQYFHYAMLIVTPARSLTSDQSLPSFLLFFFPHLRTFQPFITGSVYIVLLLFSFFLWKKRKTSILSDFLFFTKIVAVTMLMTPLAWEHHLVFLIPLCLGLVWEIIQTKNQQAAILFPFVFLLFFTNGEDMVLLLQRVGLGYFPLFYFHALIGIAVVFGSDVFFGYQR